MKEALKLALEAFDDRTSLMKWQIARDAVREALAQPEQEPVAWMYPDALCDRSCLYVCTKAFTQFPECATTPPQRTWVGLTDEETAELVHRYAFYELTRQIEAKLKEKNNDR